MTICAYVDGESHFIRSEACWKKMHGAEAELEDIVHYAHGPCSVTYPDADKPHIRIDRRGKFFWDTFYPYVPPSQSPFHAQRINTAVYYTDFSGNDPDLHAVRVSIRKNGFDPQVIKERSQLAKHRDNRLMTDGILEKPKGVDIGLTVRLFEDAYRKLFETCCLFTSDVDFIPLIQAVQRIGQKVVVFGYKDGMGSNSDLEYVPDGFFDLGAHMRKYNFRKAESLG